MAGIGLSYRCGRPSEKVQSPGRDHESVWDSPGSTTMRFWLRTLQETTKARWATGAQAADATAAWLRAFVRVTPIRLATVA